MEETLEKCRLGDCWRQWAHECAWVLRISKKCHKSWKWQKAREESSSFFFFGALQIPLFPLCSSNTNRSYKSRVKLCVRARKTRPGKSPCASPRERIWHTKTEQESRHATALPIQTKKSLKMHNEKIWLFTQSQLIYTTITALDESVDCHPSCALPTRNLETEKNSKEGWLKASGWNWPYTK